MGKKRFTPKQIISMLREIGVLQSHRALREIPRPVEGR